MISAHAKASTPFGVLAGRTALHTVYGGDDLVTFLLTVGSTPVEFAVAGKDLRALVDELVGHMGVMNREHAERELARVSA